MNYLDEKKLLKSAFSPTTEKPAYASQHPGRIQGGPGEGTARGEGLGPWCLLHRKPADVSTVRTLSTHVRKPTFLRCGNNSGIQVQLIQIHFFRALTTKMNDFPGTRILGAGVRQTVRRPFATGQPAPGLETALDGDPTGQGYGNTCWSRHLVTETPDFLSPEHPLSWPRPTSPSGPRADPRALGSLK